MDTSSPEELAAFMAEVFDKLADDPAWLACDEEERKNLMALADPEVMAATLKRIEEKKNRPFTCLSSFSLDWYSCGLNDGSEPVHERIKVYQNRNRIDWRQYDGNKNVLKHRLFHISSKEKRTLFRLFREIFGEYNGFEKRNKLNYCVDVCDGSEWEIRVRYSSTPDKHIRGNVEMPPYGRQIEEAIKEILSGYDCDVDPVFFGIE